MDGAVDELVRWASPVLTFRRTARRDTELRGQRIAAGEKVVLFYRSGNFDADVFADPDRFDITRSPDPQIGFGGGPHFCLGSHLARMQLRAVFDELLHRLPTLTVGEPVHLAGNVINGIERLPARLCSLRRPLRLRPARPGPRRGTAPRAPRGRRPRR
ncbi:cytochrome P450 [Pseudonocardia oceani]|uniref:cytochrome P450 n=1 Tax=Pseudonocardia oceani TaxID=2792013 RepID=UPI001CF6AD6B|nr:cytochrome P450 [Pseudonocardia oceani]